MPWIVFFSPKPSFARLFGMVGEGTRFDEGSQQFAPWQRTITWNYRKTKTLISVTSVIVFGKTETAQDSCSDIQQHQDKYPRRVLFHSCETTLSRALLPTSFVNYQGLHPHYYQTPPWRNRSPCLANKFCIAGVFAVFKGRCSRAFTRLDQLPT